MIFAKYLPHMYQGAEHTGRRVLNMGGGGGGGPTTSTTYTSNIPEWLRPQTEALLGAATQEYFNVDPSGQITGMKPFRPFSEDKESYFAPFTQQQQDVFGEVGQMTTSPLYGSGAALAGQSGVSALGYGQQAAGMGGLYERMATDPMSMQGYMSPYMQQVVERQKLAAIEDAQRANLGQNLGAVRQGTYGGARQALAQSQREASLEKQLGDIQAQGLQSAFDQARQAQQFGVTTGLQGLQTGLQGLGTAGQMGRSLADIASAQQQADVQRVGLQSEIGAQQQAREQGIIDQRIQDFALAEQYPFQQLSGYSGLLRGYSTPTTTINQYRAAQSPITQLAGTGIQLGGTAQALGVGGGRKAGGQIKSYAQGGITSVDALESMAEDLSIPQIQQSVKNKTLPGYVGIPILENKVNNAERIKMAQGIAPDMGQEPPIADQVMARADALQGIDSVATGAGGGMVAFERGGPVQYADGSQGYLVGALVQGARVAAPYVGRAVGRGYKALRDRTLGSTKAGILALPAGFLLGDDPEELYKIDDFPGMDLGETALADPAKQQGGANATKQGGAADAANQGDKAGPAKQGGPGTPGGKDPVEKELSRAELFALREKEQKDFLGEDPRIAKMQEALAKQGEEGFLDRALRGLQYVVAGEKIKKEGDTSQLEKITQSEMARRKEMADREMKKAELEGADYQRKAGIYKEVAGEERERAKTKADRVFQEKLLDRKLKVQEKIAGMRPESATAELIRLGKSKDPIDRQIYKDLTASKSGAMTREDAAKLALQANPGLIYPGKEKELEDMIARIMGSVGGGGGGGGGVDKNNPLLK
jgi:hypothetical protein